MFTYRLYRPALSHLSVFALLKMRANRELLNYLKTCTHTYTHIYIYKIYIHVQKRGWERERERERAVSRSAFHQRPRERQRAVSGWGRGVGSGAGGWSGEQRGERGGWESIMSNERSARSHESVDSRLSKGDVRSFFTIVVRLSPIVSSQRVILSITTVLQEKASSSC